MLGSGTDKARVARLLPSPGPPAPAGRPSPASFQALDVESFHKQCCSDVAGASDVEMASFMYDDPTLHGVLLKRLKRGGGFKLVVYLDAEVFAGSLPRYQKARVRALFLAGATVFLCRGSGPNGAFHCKGLVVDRRYMYIGSANLTWKSRSNGEFCFRVTGPAVAQILQQLSAQRLKRKPWDGA